MLGPLEHQLEVIWSDTEVDVVLEAHDRLRSVATKDDLPALVNALKSDRTSFWIRELLAEPIAELGGVDYLPDLFDALKKNYQDGHDSDSLKHFLGEIAELNPTTCKTVLNNLLSSPEFSHREYAEWLLNFCE